MDILAHGLWVGIGLAAVSRRNPISRRTALLTVGLAVLPDIVHLLPVLALSVAQPGGFATLQAYANALPGLEPSLPPLVESLSHHLHCTLHSAVVAAAVTAAVWVVKRSVWIPLVGWWSHIVIDVFTHSGVVVLFVQVGALCSENPLHDKHLRFRLLRGLRVLRADWCASSRAPVRGRIPRSHAIGPVRPLRSGRETPA